MNTLFKTPLRAYNGDAQLKADMLREMKWHREQDMLQRGQYWAYNFERGCAVGCGINSIMRLKGLQLGHGEHKNFELIGIPSILAWVCDAIFESSDSWASWPEKFLDAIPVGADLSLAWPRLALWIIENGLPEDSDSGAAADIYNRICCGGRVSTEEAKHALGEVGDLFNGDLIHCPELLEVLFQIAIDASSAAEGRGAAFAIRHARQLAEEYTGKVDIDACIEDEILAILASCPVPTKTEEAAI